MTFDKPIKVLLVNPATPASYWGFQEAAWFVGARAAHIPLPLITVAALLPRRWQIRLVDMNVERLRDKDIAWADAVFLTAMIIQKDSLIEVLWRCRRLGVPTVVGGPFVSCSPDDDCLTEATALAIGEAEMFAAELVESLEKGWLRPAYVASEKPELEHSPAPRYDLLKPGAYVALALQVSRGCPHRCEFCNVQALFGRRPRYKMPSQIVAELQAIFDAGFRGNVFFVDDNFIGNVRAARSVLEAVCSWQERNGYPFLFYTEADVRLAANEEMVDLMVKAGFFAVFLGLETPSQEALKEAHKTQNLRLDIAQATARLREKGLLVFGGFIVGFDADDQKIFSRLYDFIEGCRIDFAMVGALIAIPGTELEKRLKDEGRLLGETSGDAFGLTNIEPRNMTRLELLRGYRWLIAKLYEPRRFFDRAYAALEEWKAGRKRRATAREWLAVLRSVIRQGIFSRYSLQYWRFLLRTWFHHPSKTARAFAMAMSGHHFFRYTRRVVVPGLRKAERSLTAI